MHQSPCLRPRKCQFTARSACCLRSAETRQRHSRPALLAPRAVCMVQQASFTLHRLVLRAGYIRYLQARPCSNQHQWRRSAQECACGSWLKGATHDTCAGWGGNTLHCLPLASTRMPLQSWRSSALLGYPRLSKRNDPSAMRLTPLNPSITKPFSAWYFGPEQAARCTFREKYNGVPQDICG